MGTTWYVGRSGRTNDSGIDQLETLVRPYGIEVLQIDTGTALHLKSAANRLDADTVLVTPGVLDEAAFTGFEVVMTAPNEGPAANVVDLGEGRLLMPSSYPATAAVLQERGHQLYEVDLSQFEAGDGGATCLSLRGRLPA